MDLLEARHAVMFRLYPTSGTENSIHLIYKSNGDVSLIGIKD